MAPGCVLAGIDSVLFPSRRRPDGRQFPTPVRSWDPIRPASKSARGDSGSVGLSQYPGSRQEDLVFLFALSAVSRFNSGVRVKADCSFWDWRRLGSLIGFRRLDERR